MCNVYNIFNVFNEEKKEKNHIFNDFYLCFSNEVSEIIINKEGFEIISNTTYRNRTSNNT